MLGIIKNRAWNWAATGKHPAAKDYISIGALTSVMEAVAAWSAKGYQELRPSKGQEQMMYSWRFWLRGAKKGTMICGLGRDSSDSIGRPFPMMIMGEGSIKGWEKSWPHLPMMLDGTWRNMESVASRRFDDVRALEEQVRQLHQPEKKPENETVGGTPLENDACEDQFRDCKQSLLKEGFGLIGLDHCQAVDTTNSALHCHGRLRDCCDEIPLGVFLGGSPQKSHLVVMQRPLSTADFIRLWTL